MDNLDDYLVSGSGPTLDLTNTKAMSGGLLPPGRYSARVVSAKLDKDKQGNDQLLVRFDDFAGTGSIMGRFSFNSQNVKVSDYARSSMKQFLAEAGYEPLNNVFAPGWQDRMTRLSVGIVVADGKPWTDKDGQRRQSPEVRGFFPLGADVALNDDIPF